jgi:uncharacterized membrane protein
MEGLYSATVLGSSIYLILWFFVIYSFLGVLVEMIFCLVQEGVLESRLGLLYLPLRPIYGVGGVACTVLLHRFIQEPILIFLFGMLICTVVEYVASFVMEKAFSAVTWDYSDKLLNLHGRICLQYSCCWGLLVLFVLYVLDRVLYSFVDPSGGKVGEIVLTVLLVLALLSVVVTLAALSRIHKRVTILRLRARGDAVTESDTGWDRLIDRLAPDPVMINSFPRTSLMIEFMELTGEQRAWVRLPGQHPASPSEPHSKADKARPSAWS